jgi:hypothetical protein
MHAAPRTAQSQAFSTSGVSVSGSMLKDKSRMSFAGLSPRASCTRAKVAASIGQMDLHLLNMSWIAVTRPRNKSRKEACIPSVDTTVMFGTSSGGLTGPKFWWESAGNKCRPRAAPKPLRKSRRPTVHPSLFLFAPLIAFLHQVLPQIEALAIVKYVTGHLTVDDQCKRDQPLCEAIDKN